MGDERKRKKRKKDGLIQLANRLRAEEVAETGKKKINIEAPVGEDQDIPPHLLIYSSHASETS